MNKKSFIKALEDNKWFDDPQELIDYRLPIVQYYLNNNIKTKIIVNGEPLDFSKIKILWDDRDFTLLNQAYESIYKQLDILKLK